MDIKSFFIQIFGQDLLKENNNLHLKNLDFMKDIDKLQTEINRINDIRKAQDERIEELENPLTKLDKYCLENFKKIPMIAYKQKREFRGVYYSIALNELITPNSYEVIKLKKGLSMQGTMLEVAERIGNRVAKTITWDSDNNLDKSGDYYLMPNETISRLKGDCEDIANVTSSMHEEMGMAYGWADGIGWHAFNVFVYNGMLYIMDNTGNYGKVALLDRSGYKIYYIVTMENSYQVDGSEIFGTVAGW